MGKMIDAQSIVVATTSTGQVGQEGRILRFVLWHSVALTGSDTSSNVLFGSLQKITAQQLGFNPVLIVTANSTGGVMGKMIDAQSIVVATASTGQVGQEGRILRFVFWHSLALAAIMGAIVMLQAYVFPWMIPE